MPAALKHGVIGAPGGKRANAGRKPEWFVQKCQVLFENEDLLNFVANVALGKKFAQLHPAGIIDAPPSIKNRLDAVQMLKEWGFGKDIQPISVEGESSELAPVPTRDLLALFHAFEGGTAGPLKERAGEAA